MIAFYVQCLEGNLEEWNVYIGSREGAGGGEVAKVGEGAEVGEDAGVGESK